MPRTKFKLFLVLSSALGGGFFLVLLGLVKTNFWLVLLAILIMSGGAIWGKKIDEETNWP